MITKDLIDQGDLGILMFEDQSQLLQYLTCFGWILDYEKGVSTTFGKH